MNIKSEKENIWGHVDKGNYHAAINLAISAMKKNKKNDNQEGVDIFIAFIREIIDVMDNEFGSK